MSTRFHELRERLLRAGVAPRRVRRYLGELTDYFADLTAEEQHAGRSLSEAQSAALARLGKAEDLAQALIERSRFRSWCARAPWAMFGFGPLILLGAAYLVACLYLWCGWNFFLPGTDTPFGPPVAPTYSFANIYFQAGKFYYYSAPILVGWIIGIIAARQRLKAIWPVLGLGLIVWMGATAQVHASRSAVAGYGHISTEFFLLGHSSPTLSATLFSTFVLFAFSMLPYLVWRSRRTFVGTLTLVWGLF